MTFVTVAVEDGSDQPITHLASRSKCPEEILHLLAAGEIVCL